MAKGIGTGAALLLAGAGAWVIWKMSNANAAVAPAATTDSIGMPLPKPDQTGQEYMDEVEAWGLSTGQMYPTMMGYGAGAADAWYAQPVFGGYG